MGPASPPTLAPLRPGSFPSRGLFPHLCSVVAFGDADLRGLYENQGDAWKACPEKRGGAPRFMRGSAGLACGSHSRLTAHPQRLPQTRLFRFLSATCGVQGPCAVGEEPLTRAGQAAASPSPEVSFPCSQGLHATASC